MTQPNDDADEGVYRAATDEEAARVQANADERAATGWWPAS